ncbi:MAG: PspA/IM30 family protein [Deltaproteobacteria bacterium]|nr:PspA/IM30 family protein [Deltaproteobacteria bacterium]
MGILSRISKVLESNLNALVEKAEDPAKMLDQAIEDMRRGKEEARAAIIEAKTQKRLLERKRDKGLADAQAYERKALQALKNNDEGLARKAIELKLAAEQRAAAEDSAVQEQESQIAQLSAAERELDQRLSQLPARKAALMARQAAAQAKGARVGAAAKAKNSVSGGPRCVRAHGREDHPGRGGGRGDPGAGSPQPPVGRGLLRSRDRRGPGPPQGQDAQGAPRPRGGGRHRRRGGGGG